MLRFCSCAPVIHQFGASPKAIRASRSTYDAGGREFRPVFLHRRMQIELAAVGENQRAQRRHRLGRRKAIDDRVALERARAARVEVAAPRIDDRFAVDEDRRRPPDIGAAGDVGGEGLCTASLAWTQLATLLRQRGFQNPKRLWPHPVQLGQLGFGPPRELSHGADSCTRQRAKGGSAEADGKRRFVRMRRVACWCHFALLWLPASSECSIDFDQAGQL
jgi:hypothetical protein